jgi:hypothetical protein
MTIGKGAGAKCPSGLTGRVKAVMPRAAIELSRRR